MLFSRNVRPLHLSLSSGVDESANAPRAFHCIKFATPAQGRGAGSEGVPGEQNREELLAVSASLQLFHFANLPVAEVEVSGAVIFYNLGKARAYMYIVFLYRTVTQHFIGCIQLYLQRRHDTAAWRTK